MADIELKIGGDSSGAQQALNDAGGAAQQAGDDVGKSVVKWQELTNALKTAASASVNFSKEAIKDWTESQRVQAQLARVAGNYTDALSAQADALKELAAVDDDVIKQSQTLLVQWGGVGAASKETEKAILDYAAATGKDAVTATQDLIRNVETGGAGLAKLGVHFTATGDKGKDLAAAVEALGKKFGGAAETDANTLSGQMKAAGIAADDAKKAFGGLLGDMLEQSGVVPTLTSAFRELAAWISESGKGDVEWHKMTLELSQAELEARNAKKALDDLLTSEKGSKKNPLIAEFTADLDAAEKKLAEVRAKMGIGPKATPEVTGRTAKGEKADAEDEKNAQKHADEMWKISNKNNEDLRKLMKDEEEFEDDQRQKADDARKKEADAQLAFARAADQAFQQEQDDFAKQLDANWKEADKALEKAQDKALKKQEETAKKLADQQKQQEQEWQQAGDAIGASFVNALATQLSKLSEGEEFDVGQFITSIISAAVSIAATAIGSAYGQPALGAAIGNIASVGIQAGYSAISAKGKSKTTKQFHDGGMVGVDGLPRYHGGGFIGHDEQLSVLQNGEYVVDRDTVAQAGGKAGIESTIKGGGGRNLNFTISAVDAKGVKELFTSDGSRGLRDALRTGQGMLPSLLGKSPR